MDPPLEDKIAFFKTIQSLQRASTGSVKRDHDGDNDRLGGQEEEHRSRCAAFRRKALSAPSSARARTRDPRRYDSSASAVTIPATQVASISSASTTPVRPGRSCGQHQPVSAPAVATPSSALASSSQQSSDGDVEIIKVTPLPRQVQRRQQELGKNKRRATTDDTPSVLKVIDSDSAHQAETSVSTSCRDTNKRRATHPLARVLNNDTSPTSPNRSSTIANKPSSATGASLTSASSSSNKRKTGKDAIKLVPEDRQVFRGLSFFYVPNNDINAVRKARITKAREHGAVWVRSLSEDKPTHVIVDRVLSYENVVAEPGWQEYADSIAAAASEDTGAKMVVVNEDYPLQCISYRKLVNPNQPQYFVKGAPLPVLDTIPTTATSSSAAALPQQEPSSSAATEASSELSLKLKSKHNNPARWDYVPPDNTPTRSGEPSAQESLSEQTRVSQSQAPSSAQSVIEVTVASPVDALDDITHVSETVLPGERTLLGESSSAVDIEDEGDELLSCIRDVRSNTDEVSNLLSLAMTEDGEDMDSNLDQQASIGAKAATSASRQPRRTTRSTVSRPAGMTTPRKGSWQDQFACMRAGVQDAGSDNPNSRTIELLQQMLDHNEQINDQWRTLSYKKAIASLKRHPVKITTAEQARGVVGIGQGISDKIEEIVRTDSLRKLEFVQNDSQFKTLQMFLKIYGVGIKKAQEWVAKGHQSLEDVVKHEQLNTGQKVGIEHFDDLNMRIPRAEVTALGEFVVAVAAEIDAGVEFIIGGSYRRGSRSSGDIDFIVTKKGTSSTETLAPFLHQLVEKLYDVGFLTATLSSLSAEVRQGHGSKWHGCCVLPESASVRLAQLNHDKEPPTGHFNADRAQPWTPIWRRIDFLLVPDTELGAAMIYFTGDDIFNRSLRLLADKKGMRLNQRGLYKDVLRGPKRVKLTEGELVESRDERKIFEILGVKWREPAERWCQ